MENFLTFADQKLFKDLQYIDISEVDSLTERKLNILFDLSLATSPF